MKNRIAPTKEERVCKAQGLQVQLDRQSSIGSGWPSLADPYPRSGDLREGNGICPD